MFYTYLWLRKDGTPYYVGKGSGNRATAWHERLGEAPKGRVVLYVAKDEADAFENEVALIWYYGRKDTGTGCLRNLTDGGENPPNWKGKKRSEHQRKAVSTGRQGLVFTQEHRDNLSAAHVGQSGYWKGKKRPPLSPECKAKIKIARTGVSISTKGKPWSEARRAAQSTKGKPWTEARRAAQNRRKENGNR